MSSFFTFYTDESICARRSAFLVPIQMWKSTFMSWSFMSVLASVSGSMSRSSFQQKQRGWIGKHTNCRNVHEGKALPSWASPLPIFPCSEFQRISQRIFWLVFRSRKCGFSIGALFPTIIVVRIFWNFRVEFNSKLVCCWLRRNNGKETCVFLQHFCFVISM